MRMVAGNRRKGQPVRFGTRIDFKDGCSSATVSGQIEYGAETGTQHGGAIPVKPGLADSQ